LAFASGQRFSYENRATLQLLDVWVELAADPEFQTIGKKKVDLSCTE
jgi:hypothetical protein